MATGTFPTPSTAPREEALERAVGGGVRGALGAVLLVSLVAPVAGVGIADTTVLAFVSAFPGGAAGVWRSRGRG